MNTLKQNSLVIFSSLAFIALSCYFVWTDNTILALFPIGLMGIYFAIFHTEKTFIAIAFLTPLSVNIEEFTEGYGLFIPTEPLLFGLMIFFVAMQLRKNIIPKQTWSSPITIGVIFYLVWVFFTSITSSNPLISFKYLLANLWFIIPMLFFGVRVFLKKENIIKFMWLFVVAISLTICYTIINHAQYNFGEKEGHWVMWPFFKDHTIYGSTVAFSVPMIFGLYLSKKHSLLKQVVLLGMIGIILTGLYFSYTRAAWLSIVAALMVLLVIKLKIKFSYLFIVGLITITTVLFSWDNIRMEMARNTNEHTTEEFGEKLQSAANVTTDASNLERINRWACAIDMFMERPIVGFGPGTYAFEYARFQDPENLTIISTNFGDWGNAHSEYLGRLSEMGLIGMLLFIAIVAAIFYKSITLYIQWPKEDKEFRVLLLCMTMSLVTYFVHGFLNNYLDTDKAAVPIWAYCAILIALEINLKRKEKLA